jgi:RNase P/RNase MRP subunit p30
MLLSKNPALASILMGRMMQNISLCQKFKVKTLIGSFSEKPFELRPHHDVISLFSIFGIDKIKRY